MSGLTGADLEAAIMNAPVTRCDDIAFQMFGISMAGYNGLASLMLAAFTFWGFTRAGRR
jgi:disulfide bond formation protein DsbB